MPPLDAIQLPSQVVALAIDIINERDWCQGQVPSSPLGSGELYHARNLRNEVVPLFEGSADKATLNPDAAKVTAYAAIACVLSSRDCYLQEPGLLWETVRQKAEEAAPDIAVGGSNYLHPIHNLNEREGQTKANILAFLSSVQSALKAIEQPTVPMTVAATVRPEPPKLPPAKGSPRPQPTPVPKPKIPEPKVKAPVKRIKP